MATLRGGSDNQSVCELTAEGRFRQGVNQVVV
jgi:hypothetical protein